MLDPEQNDHFIDRYLEIPVSLSNAMFICTANKKEAIPPALQDRMEFIEFRSYTKDERLVILEKFLLPRSLEEYKIADYPIVFTDEAIEIVSNTTQVRQIEKRIRKLLRRAAVQIEVYKKDNIIIDQKFIKEDIRAPPPSRIGF